MLVLSAGAGVALGAEPRAQRAATRGPGRGTDRREGPRARPPESYKFTKRLPWGSVTRTVQITSATAALPRPCPRNGSSTGRRAGQTCPGRERARRGQPPAQLAGRGPHAYPAEQNSAISAGRGNQNPGAGLAECEGVWEPPRYQAGAPIGLTAEARANRKLRNYL